MRKTFWIFYLVVALAFIQGARLHVHFYDRDLATSDHAHQEQVHFNYDTSETDHPDGIVEIDLSKQGFLKNFSFGSLVIAFFIAVIVILSPHLITRVLWRYDRYNPLVASWPFSLRPPLRAPPL